jgi:hypothetical protein
VSSKYLGEALGDHRLEIEPKPAGEEGNLAISPKEGIFLGIRRKEAAGEGENFSRQYEPWGGHLFFKVFMGLDDFLFGIAGIKIGL